MPIKATTFETATTFHAYSESLDAPVPGQTHKDAYAMPNIPNATRVGQEARRLGVFPHRGRRSARDPDLEESAGPAEPKAKAKPKPKPNG